MRRGRLNQLIGKHVLLPKAHCVFLKRVPRNKTLSFFKGNVLLSQMRLPSNRLRLLFGASYSISARKRVLRIHSTVLREIYH